MKKTNFLMKMLLAVMLVTGFAFTNAYGQDSLQVYYDGETTPPEDLSGNDNNPADKTPTLADSGIGLLGQCFDLRDGSIVRGAGFDLNITNQFTIMAFVNPTACTGGIFNYSGFSLNSWKVDDNTVQIKCAMRIDNDSETDIWFEVDGHNITAGEWYHIAFTYDGTDAKIYIDGQEVLTQAQTVDHINVDKNGMRIALGYGYTGQAAYFTGQVDEAKILNKALSQAQIANESLIAYAGNDQNVGVGSMIALDGSNSLGTITTYSWTLGGVTVGTTAEINTDTLSVGSHIFTLTVSDGTNNSSDDVTVNVASVASVPGDNQTIGEGTLVTLDGSGSVGDNLTYKWTLAGEIVGTTATIATDTLSIGVHIFNLEVSDGTESSNNNVTVTVEAVEVTAKAGLDRHSAFGSILYADASQSTGAKLTYNWRLNETVIGTTSIISTDTLSIGEHKFALAVTDIHDVTAVDTVIFKVENVESLVDFETLANDTAFLDMKNSKKYLVFDVSNGTDKTNGDRLPETGAAPTLVPGVKGQAMQFDGSHDWINLQYAYTKGGFSAISKDYSTSVWFNTEITHRNPPKNPSLVIFDTPGMGLMLNGDVLYATLYLRDHEDSERTRGAALVTKPFTTTGEWTNVTMVFEGGAADNGASSLFKVYINGVLYETKTVSDVTSFYADYYDWSNIGATTGYASIASNVPESTHPYLQEGDMDGYFKGIIDELITTRTALTNQEVLDIYNDTDIPNAINSTEQTAKIEVYPNPTKGEVRISGINGSAEVDVLNLAGNTVKSIVISANETINLSDLNSGIYIIRVKSEDTVSSSKITVTK